MMRNASFFAVLFAGAAGAGRDCCASAAACWLALLLCWCGGTGGPAAGVRAAAVLPPRLCDPGAAAPAGSSAGLGAAGVRA